MDRNNVKKYDENGLFSCGISSPASFFANVWVNDCSINHKEKKIVSKYLKIKLLTKNSVYQQIVNFQHELTKIIDKLHFSMKFPDYSRFSRYSRLVDTMQDRWTGIIFRQYNDFRRSSPESLSTYPHFVMSNTDLKLWRFISLDILTLQS